MPSQDPSRTVSGVLPLPCPRGRVVYCGRYSECILGSARSPTESDPMSGLGSDSASPVFTAGDDEEFEEVVCEHECREGFRVLLGRSIVVLICRKCRLEYDLSQDSDQD